MYSDDLIYWLTKILISSKNKTSIYNVGSDKPIEIRKLANIIGKIAKPASIAIRVSKDPTLKEVDTISCSLGI